jgi:hypothetical protein
MALTQCPHEILGIENVFSPFDVPPVFLILKAAL